MLTSKYSGRHKEISSIKNCKNKTMHYEYHQFCFQEQSIPTYLTLVKKQLSPGLNILCSHCFFCSHPFLLTLMPQWATGQR